MFCKASDINPDMNDWFFPSIVTRTRDKIMDLIHYLQVRQGRELKNFDDNLVMIMKLAETTPPKIRSNTALAEESFPSLGVSQNEGDGKHYDDRGPYNIVQYSKAQTIGHSKQVSIARLVAESQYSTALQEEASQYRAAHQEGASQKSIAQSEAVQYSRAQSRGHQYSRVQP